MHKSKIKYVITGGAGFIGSHIVDRLVEKGFQVHVIDNFSTGKKENCNPNAQYHNLDISLKENSERMVEIMNGAHGVFHLAALARVQPSIDDPLTYEKVNSYGTINVLKCAVDSKVNRLVYSASSSAYGNQENMPLKETDAANPISPYALQKLYGEKACKMFSEIYDIETVSLRYFNVYGERQLLDGAYCLVIGTFANQRLNNNPLTIRGDGEQKRDFTYVLDVVDANILAMNSSKVGNGEVINIGNGSNTSVKELATYIGGEFEHIDPVIEPRETLACNKKAKHLLDWQPSGNLKKWIKEYKNDLGIVD